MASPRFPTAASPPRWAVVTWVALILGLIAGLCWIGAKARVTEAARSTVVAERRSPASLPALRDCLDRWRTHGLALRERRGMRESPGRWTATNEARHLTVEVADAGRERIVRVRTRDGEALRASDSAILEECLALPPG